MGLLTRAVKDLLRGDEFRQWFGRSRLIDDNGDPMRLFHITANDFDAFKAGGNDPELSGRAIWLGDDPSWLPANHNVGARDGFRQGANTIPVYARMENPLYIDEPEMLAWARAAFTKNNNNAFPHYLTDDSIKAVRDEGYDGIYVSRDVFPNEPTSRNEYILFDPGQIKSAVSNTGAFSRIDPRIIASVLASVGGAGLLGRAGGSQNRA